MKVEMNTMLRSALLASAASASLLAMPAIAVAQDAGEGVDVGEIVVTGSRIRRDTFSSAQPLSVVTAEAIRESGQADLGDVLLEQPALNANTNQQNSSSSLFLSGQSRADIRGLGASRTLVVMDGRRLPFSDASSPAVDLNLIPSLQIERVETIAGGASAVYGSEAIAGVVNLIMKKQHDGLEIDLQGGITDEKDGEEFRLGVNWGKKFFGDKLSVLIGGEIARVEPIMQRDRDELYPGVRRNNSVSPQTVIPATRSNTSDLGVFQLRTGALGTALAVARDQRDPSQITRLSAQCSTPTVQVTCQDESLGYASYWSALQGRTERGVIRGYVEYEVTDNWVAFAEGTYSRVEGYGIFQPAFSTATGAGITGIVLRGDNAFLNGPGATAAALRSIWTAPVNGANGQPLPFDQRGAGLTLTSASVAQVGKFWTEFGTRDVKTDREQLRLLGGMRGEFETFGRAVNWDWYVQYSDFQGSTTSFGQPNLDRLRFATDAINVNGQVVCRATTSADAAVRAAAAGCVPWDLVNGASREAVLYANGVSTTIQDVSQTVAALNFATNLFELPAGPVGIAFGGEYRKEKSRFEQDALGASGALFINPIGTREGEFSVKEAYGEIRVPILKDMPFAKDLSFEAAGRLADYTTIGGTDQYRLVLNWAPVEDIRFRASEATAVRAPNIVELFSPQSRNFTTTAQDPCDSGVFRVATAAQQAARRVTCAAAIQGWDPNTFISNIGTGRSSLALLQGGNPNLGPETANTYQYGVVIQPRWIPNLQISADFFKYNIKDQVGTIPINTLFQTLCYDSTTAYNDNDFCRLIIRDASGVNSGNIPGGVQEVVLTNQNVAKIKVEGWDYAVAYRFNTEDVLGRDYGEIGLNLSATWMYQWALQGLPGQAYTQLANTVTNATPEWKGTGTLRWSRDNMSVSWTTHYIGSMRSTTAFQPSQLDPYYTGDYFRHDLRVGYEFRDGIRLRAGVLNITDKFPPNLPETATGTTTGASNYDNRGRFFYVGANMSF